MLTFCLLSACALRAEVTVSFSTADAGVEKSVPDWGLDTNWASEDNMRRGLSYMGVESVNLVRVPAMVDQPMDGGLTAAQKDHLTLCKRLAAMATSATRWDLCAPGSDTVNAWFQAGAGVVNTDRWITALRINQEFYAHPMWLVEPFNEPDYATWGEGTRQNLLDIITGAKALPNFSGSLFGGGSTMSVESAASWFDALGGKAEVGTTHTLYGSVANYADFLRHVADAKAVPFHPEGHNVVEAILGAEYGLQGMIWWGTAELVRGEFVKACKGRRLAYAEDRANWTAAAVYRSPGGAVKAFMGASERVGGATTYTLHCSDRDVYFDGHGPQRDYTVSIAKDQERMVNITWGEDVPIAIGGRYAIVNASSGLCLEIAGGATTEGAALQQNAFTGTTQQLWDVSPLSSTLIGDQSYFLLSNVNSRIYADVPAWVHDDELVIRQYNYPANAVEHWYFEYAGKGCYRIRSRWSNKCLALAKTGGPLGTQVVQRSAADAADQLWRLQSPEATPKAVPLQISSQPQPLDAAPGQSMSFAVAAAGTGLLKYQWRLNGNAINGANSARLVLDSVKADDAGDYSVVVSDVNGSLTSGSASLRVRSTPDLGRLNNLSIRSLAGTGSQTLTVGFVIGGPAGRKTVLVRGIGPSLGLFGLTGVLTAPQISLFDQAALLQSGAAWGGAADLAAAFASVGAFALERDTKDAALLPNLPTGVYTAQLTGAGGGTGVALMELYDTTPASSFDASLSPRLTNASARTQVGINEQVLIAGFAIGGSTARTVLIRAVGPTLANFGVTGTLVAPRLDLIQDGNTLATNIGWAGDPQIASASRSVGAFDLSRLDSKDSVLLVTLPPGTYSAKVSGADGGTGVALVEVYDLP
jgi:hypothetical protein